MAPEKIFGFLLASAIVLGVIAKFMPKRQPISKVFKCSRCGTASTHDDRTIKAWRNGKTKFFCQTCHAKWLQSRPLQERGAFSSHGPASNSGCLGVVALFVFLPLGCLFVWVSFV